MAVAVERRSRKAAAPTGGRGFRPEIQALRALAVAGVVLFHLWPVRLTGGYIGVDVFFVISGYLITSHLLREVESTGRIKLSSFYARRIRRLLPASMLVLLITAVATITLAPRELISGYLFEIAASALYFVNWVLAINSVDYFAAVGPESPVQHYWSLSVEEQFYLVWPLIFLIVALVAAASAAQRRRALLIAMSSVFVVCLVYSIIVTAQAPQPAYFNSVAHAWEFAAGGILGLLQSRIDASRWGDHIHIRAALLWGGLLTVAATMVLFGPTTPVPGWIALIAVIGTLAVIAGGVSRARWSPSPILAWRPVQFVGDVSYSMYLWHWPLIVLAPFLLERDLSTWDKIAIIVLTVLLSWLTRRFVEQPVIRSSAWKRRRVAYVFAAGSAAIMVVVCAVPTFALQQESASSQQSLVRSIESGDPCVGAAAMANLQDCDDPLELDPDLTVPTADYETLATEAAVELGVTASCEQGMEESDECTFGDREDAAATVALVGDSHAEHLLPPLAFQAGAADWAVEAYMKRSCPFVVSDWRAEGDVSYKQNNEDCIAWRDAIVPQIAQDPDIDVVVVTTYGHRVGLDGTEQDRATFSNALAQTWRILEEAGKRVIVVADTPVGIGNDMAECLAEADSAVECANTRDAALPPDPLRDSVDSTGAGTTLLDLTDDFCDEEHCYAAIGGLPVYDDSHHLTPAFSLSLAPSFTESIRATLER